MPVQLLTNKHTIWPVSLFCCTVAMVMSSCKVVAKASTNRFYLHLTSIAPTRTYTEHQHQCQLQTLFTRPAISLEWQYNSNSNNGYLSVCLVYDDDVDDALKLLSQDTMVNKKINKTIVRTLRLRGGTLFPVIHHDCPTPILIHTLQDSSTQW